LGTAINYFNHIPFEALIAYENRLTDYAWQLLSDIPSLQIVGHPQARVPIISFVMDGVHPHDLGTYLDQAGICVRAGHHCAQPLMRYLGHVATVRASFAFYNTLSEIDYLADTLRKAHAFSCKEIC